MTAPSRASRAPHWVVSGLGTAALIVAFVFVVILPAGYVLVHLSNLLDLVFGATP